jgi:transcriptional regulator with XRE-family HTH domain
MSDETFLKEDLVQLRKGLGLTQQEMADHLGMALRAYQAIEAGESEYRYIHRLAAERVALAIAADRKSPKLAPDPVRDDAIELVRVGHLTGNPAYSWEGGRAPSAAQTVKDGGDTKFRAAYAVVGEFLLLTNALDYQLNHVLIQVLPLTDSAMLEAVIASLDTAAKIEILKERSTHIAQPNWRKPVLSYLEKLEHISQWRNIACHTALVPDAKHGAVFAVVAAAKLLKSMQIGEEPTTRRIPIAELKSAITLGESALGEGQNLIENFQKFNAERVKRLADARGRQKSPMITVYRVPISKKQFETIPSHERALVFVAGHVLNQVSVFIKLVRFSTNSDPTNPIEERVSAAQSQLILRCLVGVLVEAWEFIRRPINQKIIGSYLISISDDGMTSYDKLKKQFGKSGLLYNLRNNFLYHYPTPAELDKAFAQIPADEDWEWYLSEANTNSFYFSCELAIGYGIMSATGEPLHIGAFGTVMQEVMQAANTLPYFLMPLIDALLTKHLGKAILNPQPGTIIENAPKLGEFWIPFFADTNPK